jgi:hypothetical protein
MNSQATRQIGECEKGQLQNGNRECQEVIGESGQRHL